ncbi:CBM35 domain-containing protein [Streptomyces sp. NBC_01264]|uniref:CBM35 domain-containing protein n=1 Tax=Streptomyces sp. NBC_01264 TaxID=2903804 RepID=UPI00224D3A00|nr:CBM35 domain-containing protein [Streptomyces sp. NBC_01264]MCX4779304.1 carbohydrate-binding protein [Streptomyces sp. NBC_01264]
MTTPANHGPNNGANQPEDDDPFGYLYEDGQAAGATPPGQGGGYGYPGPAGGAQPGVPRTSYNQVRTVGDRPYGGQRGPVPYQQGPPQQQAYQAQYQAPEALQAGGYGVPPQQQPPQYTQSVPLPGSGGGHGGGGSSRRGMLIAAVAVVAAVAIGIGAAVIFGKDDDADKGKNNTANTGQSPSAPAQSTPSGQPSNSAPADAPLPKGDAGGPGMVISGNAGLSNAVPGAESASGQYVGNFNQPGAAVTWTLDLPKGGTYRLYVRYGIPGEDANATLTVNGKPNTSPLNMKNFAKSPQGDWEKGWQRTWGQVTLKEGTNTVKLSCEAGNKCQVNIDQLWLEKG